MEGKIKIRTVSNFSILAAAVLAFLCITISVFGFRQYEVLRSAMQDYISCENAAHELQEGSDILTKQVHLAAATGETKYIDAYFEEANITRRRQKALDDLSSLKGSSQAIEHLQEALSASVDLMQTEYYAMRLVEESIGNNSAEWPDELQTAVLSQEDAALTISEKLSKAQQMVISPDYENTKDLISSDVNAAISSLTDMINQRQDRAGAIFVRIFLVMILCILIFAVMMLLICLLSP